MTDHVDFSIYGHEYSVSIDPAQRDTLLAAVALVDGRMYELESRTHAGCETLAVMTALNIAHDLLQLQRGSGLDLPGFVRRIEAMGDKIDQAMAPQEKLF